MVRYGQWQEWACLLGAAGGACGAAISASLLGATSLDLPLLRAGLGVAGAALAYGSYRLARNPPPLSVATAKVVIPAVGLGVSFATGLHLAATHPRLHMFGGYMACLSFFHASEYFTTALFNKPRLSCDSYLLNHSWAYGLAAVASWIEFGIEATLCPWIKLPAISRVGLLLTVFGEVCRKLAMFTARHNFSHIIQDEHAENHVLVTHGIYGISRHPSYMGWFYWSIGTQVLLCNPICTIAYALASHHFFSDRIQYEEVTLLNFFQTDYVAYQQQVGIGIPFLKGAEPTKYQLAYWDMINSDKPSTN